MKVLVKESRLQKLMKDIIHNTRFSMISSIDAFESSITNLLCHFYNTCDEVLLIFYQTSSQSSYNVIAVKDNKLDKFTKISLLSRHKKTDVSILKEKTNDLITNTKNEKIIVIGDDIIKKCVSSIETKDNTQINFVSICDSAKNRIAVDEDP